jgi:alpha-glucosidase
MILGAFNPIYRNHSEKGSNNQEPWAFGPEYEKYMKAAIEQRYRMLPYIYTATEEASRTGIPIMRPLFLEFPGERWLNDNQREFMFGPSMLVAPKVSDNVDAYAIHLPSGTWYDYWTGAKHTGGEAQSEKFKVQPAINEIPVLVKAGSIIPEQPLVQSTAFVPQGPLELRVYPGPDCSGQLYQDDGHSFNYRTGGAMRLAMSCSATENSASITLAPQQGGYKPWFTELRVTFFDAPKQATSAIAGSSQLRTTYDPSQHSVTIRAPYQPAGTTIQVAY